VAATTDNAVHVTVDIVLLSEVDGEQHVLLVRRSHDSDAYPDQWALPGGYVDAGERIDTAARRELAEETNVSAPAHWQQVGIYDAPDRDPRGRVMSVAYVAVLPGLATPTAGDDAVDARWMPLVNALTAGLAFDHDDVLIDAVACAYGVSTRPSAPQHRSRVRGTALTERSTHHTNTHDSD
jgi:8-oxo-dGTP diphosphatase